jgi:hypothetical protein
MNVRLITGLIFVIIILGGFGLFFMNEQNTKELAERVSPTIVSDTIDNYPGYVLTDTKTASSMGQRVTFQYPNDWTLKETTIKGGRGQFGIILQSWVLQSFPLNDAGQGGIPENSAKIDIEIQTGGENLPIESLVDCGMKTTSCEKISIDNEQFIRSEQTLNTGMKAISVATFFDNKILRANALIASGAEQQEKTEIVNAIFQSINFSETPR